ncbi:glycerophosphodiester phosphodiesterase family protein [Salibacterium lacus]|uniref:Glycerophosphodiester phosphodiesterase family protein n=1 Tax=Salibacterium lacus TaxID=1898109 RepID=A0ABW5T2S1_9BACI
MVSKWRRMTVYLLFILFIAACSNEKAGTSEGSGENETKTSAESSSEDPESSASEVLDPSAVQDQEIMNIAHRGASGSAPEATTFAFDQAAEVENAWLEMDVQKTKDGRLVVIHDEDVKRTTNGEGEVGEFTLKELQNLDAGSWFNEENPNKADESYENASVMTLKEVFERYGTEENYYIETKSPELNNDMEEPLVELVEEYDLIENNSIIIQSFNQDSLKTIHELNQDIPLIQLLWWEVDEETGKRKEWLDITPAPEDMTAEDYEEIRSYAAGIGPHLTFEDTEVIDEEFVQKTLDHNLLFHVYTINSEDNMERLIDWGVTGIFTNYPEQLQRVIEETENDS